VIATSFGIAALGVSILIRAGQLSFGHAMFACAAGYAVAFVARAWPQLDSALLILLGTVFGAVMGVIIGLFVVRYRAIFFGMLNLALSMVLFSILGKFYSLTGGTDGIRLARSTFFGMQLERDGFETALLIVAVVLAVALAWAVQRYLNSIAGQALAAVKTNETRLEYVGLSANRALWIGYVISAGLCGLSGAMFALMQGLVTPEMGYWVRSGEIVFISILGGIGHPVGAFLGAVVFEFVKLYSAALFTGAWQMVLGFVLIGLVFFVPTGLSGLLFKQGGRREENHDASTVTNQGIANWRSAAWWPPTTSTLNWHEGRTAGSDRPRTGAGKTTFINICTGFIRPSGGSVSFDGRDITRLTPRAIVQRGISRSFQLPQLFLEHTVRDCIRLAAAGRSGKLRIWTPLEKVIPEPRSITFWSWSICVSAPMNCVRCCRKGSASCSTLPWHWCCDPN